MKQTFYNYQNLSQADKVKVMAVLTWMGILLILLGFLVGMLLRQRQFEFSLATLPIQATPAALIPVTAPTAFEQIGNCNLSTLVLGTTTFQIQDLLRGTDGSLAVPGDTSGIAYRVDGTGTNRVFIVSPTPQNISVMSTISIGSPVTVMGLGCTPVTYSLTAPQAGALDGSIFAGQPNEEITVFFPTVSSGAGFTFQGRRVTDSVLTLLQPTPVTENTLPPTAVNTIPPAVENTSVPSIVPTEQSISSPTVENIIPTSEITIPTLDSGETSVEISLSDNPLIILGTSIRIEILISNYGKSSFTLSESDVSITESNGAPLALQSSNPSLPEEIQPGETKTFQFVFPRPVSQTSTLKILTVEYDVDVE